MGGFFSEPQIEVPNAPPAAGNQNRRNNNAQPVVPPNNNRRNNNAQPVVPPNNNRRNNNAAQPIVPVNNRRNNNRRNNVAPQNTGPMNQPIVPEQTNENQAPANQMTGGKRRKSRRGGRKSRRHTKKH